MGQRRLGGDADFGELDFDQPLKKRCGYLKLSAFDLESLGDDEFRKFRPLFDADVRSELGSRVQGLEGSLHAVVLNGSNAFHQTEVGLPTAVFFIAGSGLAGSRIESRTDAVIVSGSELELRNRTDRRRNPAVLGSRRNLLEKNGFRVLFARISCTLVRKIHSGLVDPAEVVIGESESELVGKLNSGFRLHGFHHLDGIPIRRFGGFVSLGVGSSGKGGKEGCGGKHAAHESGFVLRSGTVILRHKAKGVIERENPPIGRLSGIFSSIL